MRLTLFSVRNPLICNAVQFLCKEIEHHTEPWKWTDTEGAATVCGIKAKTIKTFLFTNCTSSFKIIISLNVRTQTGA